MAIAFTPITFGLGLRGPPGFYQAILAAGGDDARGAALVVLAILLTTAAGTTLVAPWISLGLVPLAFAGATVCLAASLVLGPRGLFRGAKLTIR
jgi:hypothetical protein